MQTRALLLDSFRMMVARKLFWVTLAINALIVIAYGSIGSNSKGLSILFGVFTLDLPMFADGSDLYRSLLQLIFANFLVPIWLAWVATILALVSTTSIFPDFQAQGAIDIVLSKPITRWKIFFVKYTGSLLFVFLQVGIFCLGVFLVVGLRLGVWNRMILLGIPIVLVFYSYLYSFNALVGIVTRSTIAALMFTMLFWFFLFVVQAADSGLSMTVAQQKTQLGWSQKRIELLQSRIHRTEKPGSIGEALKTSLNDPDALRARLKSEQTEADDARTSIATFEQWRRLTTGLLAALPKNQQTISLLDRWIRASTNTSLNDIFAGTAQPSGQSHQFDPTDIDTDSKSNSFNNSFARRQRLQQEAAKKMQAQYDARSPWFIVGTSLGFEAVILLLAGWIFARRDY